jgi:gliding motility associated protien GldN
MTLKEFKKNLEIPGQELQNGQDIIADSDCEWGDCNDKDKKPQGPAEYLPKEACQLEIREELFFDARHSKMKHDVLSITLIIPGDKTPAGLDKFVATYSYKELCEKLFKDNPNAIWYNTENQAAHMNLSHAFDLRLYYANIVKFENAQDRLVTEMYGEGKQAFYAGQEIEYKLLEFESNLWSH